MVEGERPGLRSSVRKEGGLSFLLRDVHKGKRGGRINPPSSGKGRPYLEKGEEGAERILEETHVYLGKGRGSSMAFGEEGAAQRLRRREKRKDKTRLRRHRKLQKEGGEGGRVVSFTREGEISCWPERKKIRDL